MTTFDICVKIPLHKNVFFSFQINKKIDSHVNMLEICLFRYLRELFCEILYSLPGWNLEIYLGGA